MSLTSILCNEKLSSENKLAKVAEIVAELRQVYGNSEVDIPTIKIGTTHGNLPFAHLENDSKVELLINEALSIKSQAIAAVEDNPGIVLNNRATELLATNSLFANVSAESEFTVL